jgi:general secretion pathway protein A
MRDHKLLAFYGLKYNPFLPSIPTSDLWLPLGGESFLYRVENLVMDGGFAMIGGEPGLGKSKLLHLLATRLSSVEGVVVGCAERATSSLGDFYRELGQLFGVTLSPANRYGSFQLLRSRWREHVRSTLFRPVLLLDEAQDAHTSTLNELRILGSERYDSENLLTVVLCGDQRLPERFRAPDLLPLGTRIRTRLVLHPYSREELLSFLSHLLTAAGAPALCTPGLCNVLVDHCAGNPRVLCTMGAELLEHALLHDKPVLDEGLYLAVFDRTPKKGRKTEARA